MNILFIIMNDTECLEFYNNNLKGKRYPLKYVNRMFPNFISYIRNRFNDSIGNESIKELIYRIEHKLEEIPKCIICGKNLKFFNNKNNYQRMFCSKECEHSSKGQKIIKEKCYETKLKRYGTGYYNNRDKYKQTNLERFGYENPNQNKEIKEKAKVTRKNTMLEKYGVENSMYLDSTKEKCKQTCLKRYGVEHPYQNEEIQEKTKEMWLSKYGVEHPWKSENVREKCKQTLIEHFGVDNCLKSDEIKEKVKNTCICRYGVENPMQNDEIKNRCKETNLKRYGVENPMQCNEIKLKAFKNRYNKEHCTVTSKKEDEIFNYLVNTYDDSTIRQYYSKEYPFHCDFYLPKYNVYIEYQGIWTHGPHPYDINSIEDSKLYKIWDNKSKESKFYKEALNIWTKRDPLKRETAKINKLNYLEIFYNDDYKIKIDNYFNNLDN